MGFENCNNFNRRFPTQVYKVYAELWKLGKFEILLRFDTFTFNFTIYFEVYYRCLPLSAYN